MKTTYSILSDKINKYGIAKCLIFAVCLTGILYLAYCLWNIDDKDSIIIEPFLAMENETSRDIEIDVIRTAKFKEGFSFSSIIKDIICSSNSEAKYLDTYNELLEKHNNIIKNKDKIEIPKGAGFINFDGIEIYSWKRSGEKLITNARFGEIEVVFICGNTYFTGGWNCSESNISLFVEVEIGTLD